MNCRTACAACCIAPSITSAIPGMPNGKPAGVPCVQLNPDLTCKLFGLPERPAFCGTLQPRQDMCGTSREEAMQILVQMELDTDPRVIS